MDISFVTDVQGSTMDEILEEILRVHSFRQ